MSTTEASEELRSPDQASNKGGAARGAGVGTFESDRGTPGATQCAHCGLVVPPGLIRESEEKQFCCNGCRTAYQLITECELDDFYRMTDAGQTVGDGSSSNFEEFDTEFFLEHHTRSFKNSVGEVSHRKVSFAIDGLHCSACIWLLEKLPQIKPGVLEATVNWNSQSITVVVAENAKLSGVARALSDLGYHPSIFETEAQADKSRVENRKKLFDLGLAGAAAGNNMLVALALYLGQFYGMTLATERLLVFYSGLISLVSVLGPGRRILSRAIWAIRTRTPHMDLPVALGISVGLVFGWINTWLGSSSVYFDSISVLIFVLLLGRYIQHLQQQSAIEKLSLVNRLLPRFCQKQQAGKLVKIAIDEIRKGDLLLVGRQETVPVDGVVAEGISSVDQSVLTGESFPVNVEPESTIFAGTINLEEPVLVCATTSSGDSKIATVFQDVEKSVRQKSRIVQFADRIGAGFVVVVIALALIAFLVWLPDLMFATNAAVAVLIVACPCALALATPVAISVALGGALKNRILIKDGDVFELLSKCQTIWFDKTGTLTEGKLEVTRWIGSKDIQPFVILAESKSGHPVAQAIVQCLQADGEHALSAENSSGIELGDVEHHSNGISANINGGRLCIGSRGLLEEKGIQILSEWELEENLILENGWSPVFVTRDQQVVAMMAIGDQIRGTAKPVIERIRRDFQIQIGILSGDRRQVVEQVARQLGLDPVYCYSELTPRQKSALVSESKQSLMIGDGVNDSAALAEASVGIAINDRLDLNSRIAPIVLKGNQLDRIPDLLTVSRRVMRLIRGNIAISLLYNLVAVTLAIAGYIHPLIAALFMPLSSMTILFISLLFRPFSTAETTREEKK